MAEGKEKAVDLTTNNNQIHGPNNGNREGNEMEVM